MYKPQFSQYILFFSCLLLCLTSSPHTLLYGSEDSEQRASSEETTPPDDKTEETTQLHYRIRQLRFDGNEHLNEKRLITLFGWQEEHSYSREEIIEGIERIIAGYQEAGFIFAETSPNITVISEDGQVNRETEVSMTVEIVEGQANPCGSANSVGESTLLGSRNS